MNSEDLGMVEMCINTIAEQCTYKKFVVKVLQSPEDTQMLKDVIKIILLMSNSWMADMNLKSFN